MIIFAAGTCFGQLLGSPDQRSTKGKIDPSNNKPIVVSINENATYGFEKQQLDKDKLFTHLDAFLDFRIPETRTIYIRAGGKATFAKIAELMRIGRKLGVDDFAFLAGDASDPLTAPKLKIVLEEPPKLEPKPWARFLGVEILNDDKILLNRKPITDTQLVVTLKDIFTLRKRNRVYIEGSKDVEKTVFIKPLLSTKFESVIAVVNIVNKAEAHPIAINIDWLKP